MDPTARFAALVGTGEPDPPLDEAALLIAAHAHRGLDVDLWVARLDALARTCGEATFDGVRRNLFDVQGFRGNVARYDDPANSFLDAVLERRVGIPITLAVVMLEVARRLGVGAIGVGMPGHFLVGDPARSGQFCDAFSGGRLLGVDDCRALFTKTFGSSHAFDESMLVPVGARAILARMLANLERSPLARDPVEATWMYTLHLSIAGLGAAERLVLVRRLANLGQTAAAATELDALADLLPDAPATRIRDEARFLRARMN